MMTAFCGFRPEEIRRTELWMVHLDADPPNVIRNTAKGGDVVVPLSAEGVLAWQMFTYYGGFDRNLCRRDRFRTQTATGRRRWCAQASHQRVVTTLYIPTGTHLLQFGGGDISLVQKARGHPDIRTTLIYTQVVVDPRLDDAVQKAFAVRPSARISVAGSRGSSSK